ncbi:MAG: DNA recombination protein RmuC [Nitrospira sp.]|nr:DNA recombination protein RmuC [bacterium]MBL7048888.1 DNA recombination protein RmuC [Nitrospira sp.]
MRGLDIETLDGSVIMETNMLFLVMGVLIGGAISSLVVYIVLTKKISVQEGEVKSSEAVNAELRKQLDKISIDYAESQNDLRNEAEIRSANEARFHEAEKNYQAMERDLSEKFDSLSLKALSKNSDEFLKLAEEKFRAHTSENSKELETKKELIEKSLQEMDKVMTDVRSRVEDVNKGNAQVSTLIQKHEDVTTKLRDTTDQLKQALASSKKRGDWGERMAEDIINLTGLIEGVNYVKQKTLESSAGRPDFTFFMPNNLRINMDVKFPLDNYMHYLNAHTEHDRKRYTEELIKNVRTMIKQVTTRDYINPSENTVDYVLMFIPNEQVYGFLNESDLTLMDDSLKQKVILCSPFTLYAVLAVVRQAIDNFNLERTAGEMLKLFGDFSKQWHSYKDRFRAMGEKLDAAKKEYDSLVTTRSNMLDKPLKKIEDLRQQEMLDNDIVAELDEGQE